jgi:TP901 family phage tail tape measure protein
LENLGTITWKVEVDTSDLNQTEREMGKAKKSSDDLESSIKKTGGSVTETGKKTKTATGQMSQGFTGAKGAVTAFAGALVALGIAKGLGDVVRATNEFEASVSQLSAITGAVGEDLEYFSAQSKDIGRTTSLSASQAVTAFKLIASAKPDLLSSREALAAVTREAVTLAEAAGVDLTQAAETVGVSLNQFGAGAEEANRFINVLAAGSKFGSSAIADTAMALKNSGAAANAAGLSFEETNAAIQALASGGIVAGEAGTGLRNILLTLEQEMDSNLRPSVVGMADALVNLRDKNLDIVEMTDIFGKQNVVAAQTLVDNAGAVSGLEEALTGTNVATEQAAINMDNLAGDIKAGESATEGLQIALGEKLTPALRDGRKRMTELTTELTKFVESDSFTTTVDGMKFAVIALSVVMATNAVAALGGMAISFAATATATGVMTTAVGGLKVAVLSLSSATGIGILITALGFLAVAFKNVGDIAENAIDSQVEIAAQAGEQSLRLWITSLQNDQAELLSQMGSASTVRKGIIAKEYRAIQERIDEFVGKLGELATEQRSVDAAALSADKAIGILRIGIKDTTEPTKALADTTIDLERGLDDAVFMMKGAVSVSDTFTDSTNELLSSIEQEIEDLGKTERELFQLTATRGLSEDATIDEIRAVNELSGALWDQQTEISATEKAEAALAKEREEGMRATEAAANRAAEETARQWGETRDTLAGYFVDMYNDGSSAFDSILGSFKAMIISMIAEWAASKLMGLFGFGGGGVTASGGFSLFGAGNTGSGSGGVGAAAGNLFSGAATSAIGATASGYLASLGTSIASAAGFGTAAVAGGGTAGVSGMVAGMASQGAVVPAAGLGSTLTAGLAAIPVWGWALLATGAAAALLDNDDGKTRKNAGFFVAPTPGAQDDPDRIFDVDAFSSGLKVQGFARRAERETAVEVIDTFRNADLAFTEMISELGGVFDLTNITLNGLDEEATAGSHGTFLGMGGNGDLGGDIESQLNMFIDQLSDHVSGLDESLLSTIRSARTADEVFVLLAEAIADQKAVDSVTSEASEENTTATEASTTAAKESATAAENFSAIVSRIPYELRGAMHEAFQDLQGITDVSGMLFDSNGNLLDANYAIVASNSQLGAFMAGLPAELQAVVASFLSSQGESSEVPTATDPRGDNPYSGATDPDKNNTSSGATDTSQARPYSGPPLTDIGNAYTNKTGSDVFNWAPDAEEMAADREADYGRAFNAVNSNLSLAGVVGLANLFPEKAEEIGAYMSSFESITGTNISEGGLELYASVRKATGMSIDEYGDAMRTNLSNALGVGSVTELDGEALSIDGSHSMGLDRVPYDGYTAELHKGERVQTEGQARRDDAMADSSGSGGGFFSLVLNIARKLANLNRIIDKWDGQGYIPTRENPET